MRTVSNPPGYSVQRQLTILAPLALVMAALFWAGNAVVGRGVIDLIPPMALSFWRWVIAFLVILPFAMPHLREAAPTLRNNVGKLFVLAFLSAGMFNTILYLAAHTTTAVNITLVGATMPIVIGAIGFLILGTRLSRSQTLGLAIAIPGLLVIISEGRPSTLLELQFRAGDLLMLLAVTSWGLYSVLLQRFGIRLHPVVLLTAIVALALPVALTFYTIEWLILRQGFVLDRSLVLALMYVGVFPSLGAYLGWNYGVSILGPARASMFIYLLPVFGAALSIAFLGEHLEIFHGIGALLILIGLYLSTWVHRR